MVTQYNCCKTFTHVMQNASSCQTVDTKERTVRTDCCDAQYSFRNAGSPQHAPQGLAHTHPPSSVMPCHLCSAYIRHLTWPEIPLLLRTCSEDCLFGQIKGIIPGVPCCNGWWPFLVGIAHRRMRTQLGCRRRQRWLEQLWHDIGIRLLLGTQQQRPLFLLPLQLPPHLPWMPALCQRILHNQIAHV